MVKQVRKRECGGREELGKQRGCGGENLKPVSGGKKGGETFMNPVQEGKNAYKKNKAKLLYVINGNAHKSC